MEPVGAIPNGEWDCFLSSLLLGEDHELNIGTQPTFWSASEPGETDHMFYSLDAHNLNSQYISQESSYTSNFGGHTNYYFSYPDHVLANNTYVSMDENFLATFVPSVTDIVMEENIATLNEDVVRKRLENPDHDSQVEPIVFPTKHLQLKRKLEVPELEVPDKVNNRSQNQKKKPRVSKDGQGCMKNARYKKNQKLVNNEDELVEETNTVSDGQGTSSNISEDDNASQENSGATSGSKSALNSNVKTKASRGSATDPQSLYARKRREKINERLRILQNLVPNGTKVDISTMLEDAVNYVKFLQLQIKLLSSDDLWMYAPLAYNGLDIGLNLNMKNYPPQ